MFISEEFRVYNIEEEIVINANHSPDNSVKYHVCYVAVDWRKNGKYRSAVFILMSYNDKRVIKHQHILLLIPKEIQILKKYMKHWYIYG